MNINVQSRPQPYSLLYDTYNELVSTLNAHDVARFAKVKSHHISIRTALITHQFKYLSCSGKLPDTSIHERRHPVVMMPYQEYKLETQHKIRCKSRT